jgi:hypothetical protein
MVENWHATVTCRFDFVLGMANNTVKTTLQNGTPYTVYQYTEWPSRPNQTKVYSVLFSFKDLTKNTLEKNNNKYNW